MKNKHFLYIFSVLMGISTVVSHTCVGMQITASDVAFQEEAINVLLELFSSKNITFELICKVLTHLQNKKPDAYKVVYARFMKDPRYAQVARDYLKWIANESDKKDIEKVLLKLLSSKEIRFELIHPTLTDLQNEKPGAYKVVYARFMKDPRYAQVARDYLKWIADKSKELIKFFFELLSSKEIRFELIHTALTDLQNENPGAYKFVYAKFMNNPEYAQVARDYLNWIATKPRTQPSMEGVE